MYLDTVFQPEGAIPCVISCPVWRGIGFGLAASTLLAGCTPTSTVHVDGKNETGSSLKEKEPVPYSITVEQPRNLMGRHLANIRLHIQAANYV